LISPWYVLKPKRVRKKVVRESVEIVAKECRNDAKLYSMKRFKARFQRRVYT